MNRPQLGFDERTLRETVTDSSAVLSYIAWLEDRLAGEKDRGKQVSLHGEVAVYLRALGKLKRAQMKLELALKLIAQYGLGIKREAQQKIRLAHVFQWQRDFQRSDALYAECLQICRERGEARVYLPFALQHAGKNFFDQEKYLDALAYFTEALQIRKDSSAPADQIESTKTAIRQTEIRRLNKET